MSYRHKLNQVNSLRTIFAEKVGIYKHQLPITPKYLTKDYKDWDTWLNLVDRINEIGVDLDTFVTAQFYYIDDWYRKSPTIGYLLTPAAVERCRRYCNEIRDKEGTKPTPKEIVGSVEYVEPYEETQEQADRRMEQVLKQLVKNYAKNGKNINWTQFVLDEDACIVFDNQVWLDRKREEAVLWTPVAKSSTELEIDEIIRKTREKRQLEAEKEEEYADE